MTLLVAGIFGQTVWMVADTLITGPRGSQDIEYQIKIIASPCGTVLIGFSGEQFRGAEAIAHVQCMPPQAAIAHLLEVQKSYPVDFAYAYIDPSGAHLIRVSGGVAEQVRALHLGVEDAFEQYQLIRHRTAVDPVPHSFSNFLLGSRSPESLPEPLARAITSMLRLFSERSERDVGGVAVPYVLGPGGAYLCGYGYSVTDPIIPNLQIGDMIPHGTAPGGGFGLSVTEFDKDRGIITYWLQKPGGTIYLRTPSGFQTIDIGGSPSEFRIAAETRLGHPVELFFGGGVPSSYPECVTILRDRSGRQLVAVAHFGNSVSFSALEISSEFRATTTMDIKGKTDLSCSTAAMVVAEDLRKATLRFSARIENNELALDAAELDQLIFMLATARERMLEPIPAEPLGGPLDEELVVVDPAWRTNRPPHASLKGLLLRLRHPGHGWLTFLLPEHESVSLGEWLSKNAHRN